MNITSKPVVAMKKDTRRSMSTKQKESGDTKPPPESNASKPSFFRGPHQEKAIRIEPKSHKGTQSSVKSRVRQTLQNTSTVAYDPIMHKLQWHLIFRVKQEPVHFELESLHASCYIFPVCVWPPATNCTQQPIRSSSMSVLAASTVHFSLQ